VPEAGGESSSFHASRHPAVSTDSPNPFGEAAYFGSPGVIAAPPALGGIMMDPVEEQRRTAARIELPLQAAPMSRRVLAGAIDAVAGDLSVRALRLHFFSGYLDYTAAAAGCGNFRDSDCTILDFLSISSPGFTQARPWLRVAGCR